MQPLFGASSLFLFFFPAENLFHCAPSSSFPPKLVFWRRQERAHHGGWNTLSFFRIFIKIVKWNLSQPFVLSPYKLFIWESILFTCQRINICIWIKLFFHKKAQRKATQSTELFVRSLDKLFNFNLGFYLDRGSTSHKKDRKCLKYIMLSCSTSNSNS